MPDLVDLPLEFDVLDQQLFFLLSEGLSHLLHADPHGLEFDFSRFWGFLLQHSVRADRNLFGARQSRILPRLHTCICSSTLCFREGAAYLGVLALHELDVFFQVSNALCVTCQLGPDVVVEKLDLLCQGGDLLLQHMLAILELLHNLRLDDNKTLGNQSVCFDLFVKLVDLLVLLCALLALASRNRTRERVDVVEGINYG